MAQTCSMVPPPPPWPKRPSPAADRRGRGGLADRRRSCGHPGDGVGRRQRRLGRRQDLPPRVVVRRTAVVVLLGPGLDQVAVVEPVDADPGRRVRGRRRRRDRRAPSRSPRLRRRSRSRRSRTSSTRPRCCGRCGPARPRRTRSPGPGAGSRSPVRRWRRCSPRPCRPQRRRSFPNRAAEDSAPTTRRKSVHGNSPLASPRPCRLRGDFTTSTRVMATLVANKRTFGPGVAGPRASAPTRGRMDPGVSTRSGRERVAPRADLVRGARRAGPRSRRSAPAGRRRRGRRRSP